MGLSSYLAGVEPGPGGGAASDDTQSVGDSEMAPLPPNPADLLSSHKLAEAIGEPRKKFKFVAIDSPPVMAATDAVILSGQSHGVLLVVRSGETPKEAFTRTRDLLVTVKCNILGVVLNAVDANAPDYYYSYRYYPYSMEYGPQETGEHRKDDEDSEPVSESMSRDQDEDSQAL